MDRNDKSIRNRAKSFLNEDLILRKRLLKNLYEIEINSIGIKRKKTRCGENDENPSNLQNNSEVHYSNFDDFV